MTFSANLADSSGNVEIGIWYLLRSKSECIALVVAATTLEYSSPMHSALLKKAKGFVLGERDMFGCVNT
jgi:hypothetical protein